MYSNNISVLLKTNKQLANTDFTINNNNPFYRCRTDAEKEIIQKFKHYFQGIFPLNYVSQFKFGLCKA